VLKSAKTERVLEEPSPKPSSNDLHVKAVCHQQLELSKLRGRGTRLLSGDALSLRELLPSGLSSTLFQLVSTSYLSKKISWINSLDFLDSTHT
jgi:hypothetical protein